MIRWLIPVLLLPGILNVALAGEVQKIRVGHSDGEYKVEISARIHGSKDRIYQIATEPETQTRLNHMIVESVLVAPSGNRRAGTVHRIVTRACLLGFCFGATLLEDRWEASSGTIRSTFVPELSDFKSGEAEWQIRAVDQDTSIVTFHSRFRPAFWIPPLAGPYFVKQLMLGAAKETILNMEKLAAIETPRT